MGRILSWLLFIYSIAVEREDAQAAHQLEEEENCRQHQQKHSNSLGGEAQQLHDEVHRYVPVAQNIRHPQAEAVDQTDQIIEHHSEQQEPQAQQGEYLQLSILLQEMLGSVDPLRMRNRRGVDQGTQQL